MTVAFCGAMTHQGKKPCRRPAGWGTSHAGYGQCKLHGGSTRNGCLHALKLEMYDHVAKIMRARGVHLSPEQREAQEFALRRRLAEIKGENE
jgi:hypothetical protein